MVTLDSCILSNLFSNVETCRLFSMVCCLKAPHCWDAVPMRAMSHRFADNKIAAFTATKYAHPWWHVFFESTFLKETHGETHKFHEKVSLEVGGFISNCWILMDHYLNAFWMHTYILWQTLTNLSQTYPVISHGDHCECTQGFQCTSFPNLSLDAGRDHPNAWSTGTQTTYRFRSLKLCLLYSRSLSLSLFPKATQMLAGTPKENYIVQFCSSGFNMFKYV